MHRLGAPASFIPLLIAVRLKANDQGETYHKILELCEKFAFRVYAWNENQTRKGQSTIYSYTREYFNERLNSAQLFSNLARLALRICSDEKFDERFERAFVNWFDWKAIKYFLYEYEQERADQRGLFVRMRWEDLIASRKEDTIEHILPQHPRPKYWKERFDEETSNRWIHDIGNLTLTYFNGALSDFPFPEKRDGRPGHTECYARSLLIIEQDLVDYEDWTVDSIQNRREKIRSWALKRWAIPSPVFVPSASFDTTTNTSLPMDDGHKAIWASKEQRDPEAWLKSLAKEKGKLEEFCQILDASREAGFFARMQNNWWVIKFTPASNHNVGFYYLGTDLSFDIYTHEIEKWLEISAEKVRALFGEKRILTTQEIPQLIASIQELAAVSKAS